MGEREELLALAEKLRRMSPRLDILDCETILQAADVLVPAQGALPPIVDRAELIALLQDLASVNLTKEACKRQARRMADDLIARGLGVTALRAPEAADAEMVPLAHDDLLKAISARSPDVADAGAVAEAIEDLRHFAEHQLDRNPRMQKIVATVTYAASPAADVGMRERAAIARLVDPHAFEMHEHYATNYTQSAVDRAFEKADAILALPSNCDTTTGGA